MRPLKIDFSPYELQPRASLGSHAKPGARRGALLRVRWEEGTGYADLHPWPELGDPALENLLREAEKPVSDILKRSLALSRADARARAKGVSLFEGLTIPESHWLVTDLAALTQGELDRAAAEGFRRVKVKVGADPFTEARKLRAFSFGAFADQKVWRLDFNATIGRDDLEIFLTTLGDAVRNIDFLEDPLPWSEKDWTEIRESFGVRLAADRQKPRAPSRAIDLAIIKPAIEEVSLGGVVTSYLDHPLGQAAAAYEAARAGIREICGLISHPAYESTAFSQALRTRGPWLLAPEGTGLGFDGLLKDLGWKPLA